MALAFSTELDPAVLSGVVSLLPKARTLHDTRTPGRCKAGALQHLIPWLKTELDAGAGPHRDVGQRIQ